MCSVPGLVEHKGQDFEGDAIGHLEPDRIKFLAPLRTVSQEVWDGIALKAKQLEQRM